MSQSKKCNKFCVLKHADASKEVFMSRQKKRLKELAKMIEQLKSCEPLSYLMLPVLKELDTAYINDAKINASWKNAHIDEIADLIEELDGIGTDNVICKVYIEVMKKSTYLIDMNLWIKIMELLISEGQGTF